MPAEPATSSATRVNSEIRMRPLRGIGGMKFFLDSEEPGWMNATANDGKSLASKE